MIDNDTNNIDNTPEHYQNKAEVGKVIVEARQQNRSGDNGSWVISRNLLDVSDLKARPSFILDEDSIDFVVKGYGKVSVAKLLTKIDEIDKTYKELLERLDKLETELSLIKVKGGCDGQRSS